MARWIIAAMGFSMMGMQSKPLTPKELVLKGQILPALREAQKSPTGVEDTLRHLLDAADSHVSERRLNEAQTTLDAAARFLDAYSKEKNHKTIAREPLEGRRLRLQGIRHGDSKEYERAEKVLQEALALSRTSGDPTLEAGVHNNLSYVYRATHRFEEAAKESLTARDIAQAQKDNLRAGSYNFNLGLALFQLNKWDPAYGAFKLAVEQNEAAGKKNLQATSLFWKARTLHRLNPTVAAPLKHLEEARLLYAALGDHRLEARCYWEMADQTAYRLEFGTAAVYAEKAVPLYTTAKDNEGLRISYMLLVDMYTKLNRKDLVDKYQSRLQELPPPK